jgi:S1-C subfamily serine protease
MCISVCEDDTATRLGEIVIMNAISKDWDALSQQFSAVAEHAGKFVVAVHGGNRVGASGLLWRAGLVVTTSHTLRRTEGIEVNFGEKSGVKAQFLGRDSGTDVAVLRLDNAVSAPPAQLGDGSGLRVGQVVMGVGRSRLNDLAASAGIIARLGAPWQTWRGGRIDSLLRPDVTLYPGQSGSALIDSGGRVLGMNTSALARAATITVPTATVERVINEIVEHGGVFRPYLGLAMQPVAVPEDLARKLKSERKSALMVMQVEPGSPSAEAGFTLGDLILSVNGQPVIGIDEIQQALRQAKRGDSVELGYARAGQPGSAKVKLADRLAR